MNAYVPTHLRVFLLDDHDIVRRGLSDLMSAKRDITVVGDSDSAANAAGQILALRPDVMVLDVHLQDGTGVQVCRQVRAQDDSIRGLLLTAAHDEEALALALLAGAAGAVNKLARSLEIIDAVRDVGAGHSLLDPAASERVGASLMAGMEEQHPALAADEEQLLSHVLAGYTDRQLAEQMRVPVEQATGAVSALVERIIAGTPWMTPLSYEPGLGKHRRANP